ncbi:WhiB family transcriptional regulator [Streptomyces sp. NPDC002692]
MTGVASREDWRASASCSGTNAPAFFSASPVAAAEICRGCRVRPECLYDGLTSDAPNGVWGGLTRSERRALPALPDTRPAALAALGLLLDELDQLATPEPPPTTDPVPERTSAMDSTDPDLRAPETGPTPAGVGALLTWGAAHSDAKIRRAAEQAGNALEVLRTRHQADEQLRSIEEESAQLEAKLAELQQRKAELAPSKKGAAAARDYEPADVRAWAVSVGTECPPRGRVPQPVVDAWRAAGAPTRQQ